MTTDYPSTAPLPKEHRYLLAYVQLYGAYLRKDGMWPRQAFTDNIDRLLYFKHAEPVYTRHRLAGYVITPRGRAFWERYSRLKSRGLTVQPKAARHDRLTRPSR